MKNTCIFAFIVVIVFSFGGCDKEKNTILEKDLQESLQLNNKLNDEIIQYKREIDNLRNEKDLNESEAYIIKSAWLILHDQPYRKVETKNAGDVIVINNNNISYNGQDYVFTDHIKSETYLSFTLFFAGMNYGDSVGFHENLIAEGYEGEVISRQMTNGYNKVWVFLAGNKFILHPSYEMIKEDEYSDFIEWDTDGVLYIAEKDEKTK
jgi:hypothetical protein